MNKIIKRFNKGPKDQAELQEVNKGNSTWYRITLTGPSYNLMAYTNGVPTTIDHISNKRDALVFFKDLTQLEPFLDRIYNSLSKGEVSGDTPNINFYPLKGSVEGKLGVVIHKRGHWGGRSGTAFLDVDQIKNLKLPKGIEGSNEAILTDTILHELDHMDYKLNPTEGLIGEDDIPRVELRAMRKAFDTSPNSMRSNLNIAYSGLVSRDYPEDISEDFVSKWNSLKYKELGEREGLEVDPYG